MTNSILEKKGYYKFPLGTLEISVFTDGYSEIRPIQPMFAPNVEPSDLQLFLNNQNLSNEYIRLAGNILLAATGDEHILIDTGCGGSLGPTSGKLLDHFASADIAPSSITHIVLTHAHPDHIGGVLTEDGALAFPNALVHLSKTEYDFWMSPEPDFSKGTHNAVADFEIQFARQFLERLESVLHFYNANDILLGFLHMLPAPGHTPGQMMIQIHSGDDKLLHIADVFQHQILVEHPEWGNQIDSDFELGVRTRLSVLEHLAESKQLLFGNHLPFSGLGYIVKSNGTFHYVPKGQ